VRGLTYVPPFVHGPITVLTEETKTWTKTIVDNIKGWTGLRTLLKKNAAELRRIDRSEVEEKVVSWLPNLCTGTSGTTLEYVIVDRLGAFCYWTRFTGQQCTVRQYHSDLSDQSALEIRVRIRV